MAPELTRLLSHQGSDNSEEEESLAEMKRTLSATSTGSATGPPAGEQESNGTGRPDLDSRYLLRFTKSEQRFMDEQIDAAEMMSTAATLASDAPAGDNQLPCVPPDAPTEAFQAHAP